jgi:hypothetical protein
MLISASNGSDVKDRPFLHIPVTRRSAITGYTITDQLEEHETLILTGLGVPIPVLGSENR